MNPQSDITILSEAGMWRHYEALLRVCRNRGVPVVQCRLNFTRRIAAAAAKLRPGGLFSCVGDLGRLLRLLVGSSRIVVAGIAPFGVWGVLLWWLRQRNRLVYHSSWIDWRRGRVPRNRNSRILERVWGHTLSGVEAVGVTAKAAGELSDFGADPIPIPHSVDVERFRPGPENASRARPAALFVGRLVPEKGVSLILEVAAHLHSEGVDVEFWFAGEGPLEKQLAESRDAGLPLTILGHLDAVGLADVYRKAELLILPSIAERGWEELFGITLVEAFASGLPVIASDCVGPREIVDPERTGLLIPQGDAQALERAVKRLLADEPLRRKMAGECRREAETVYSVEVVAARWTDVLDRTSRQRLGSDRAGGSDARSR